MDGNNVKAFGSFVKQGSDVFRTAAYLQWGDSKESLGACLLLNPGSARLTEEFQDLLDLQGRAEGEVKMDPTMKSQLVKIVEGVYDQNHNLSGRFHIYNLFTLREGNNRIAINRFEELCKSGIYPNEGSLASIEELRQHPWMLLGWGINPQKKWSNLQMSKRKWLLQLSQADVPIIGKKKSGAMDYYHPLPQLVKNRGPFVKEIVKLYRQNFK